MNKEQIELIAHKNDLGYVRFEWRTARNTGQRFEVGYVEDIVNKRETLFCKRQPHSTSHDFYLCNEFENLIPEEENK